MQKAIKAIKTAPQAYIQLFLLNLALTIILIKQIQITYAIISFVFCFLLTSLLHFKAFQSSQSQEKQLIQVIHQDINHKFNTLKEGLTNSFLNSQTQQNQQKKNYALAVMIIVYFSINFLCSSIETFLILNVSYTYFFMPEISKFLKEKCCSIYNGQCPFAKQK